MTRPVPSPEVKALISQWVKMQRAKYGPNWKEIVAKEMVEKTAPMLCRLIDVLGHDTPKK